MRAVVTLFNGAEEVIGYAFVKDNNRPYDPAIIQNIYVVPGHENHGHATALLRILMVHARRENKTLIADCDWGSEVHAWNMLSDAGFRYDKQLKTLKLPWNENKSTEEMEKPTC